MINRTLSKRVQKLEARLIPTEEPRAIHVVYVSPDGTRTEGYTVWALPETPQRSHRTSDRRRSYRYRELTLPALVRPFSPSNPFCGHPLARLAAAS